jgi:hypothetical protein
MGEIGLRGDSGGGMYWLSKERGNRISFSSTLSPLEGSLENEDCNEY